VAVFPSCKTKSTTFHHSFSNIAPSRPQCTEIINALDVTLSDQLPQALGYVQPESIAVGGFHLLQYIAFASINKSFHITNTAGDMVVRGSQLRKRYIELRVNIAVVIH